MVGIASGLGAVVASRSGDSGHGIATAITTHLPWLVAVLAIVAAVFRNVLQQWITTMVNGIGNAVYLRLANSWLLRRVAVRKYIASVSGKNAEFTAPFHRDKPLRLDEVYVPLEFRTDAGKPASAGVDITRMLAEGKRILVLGAPGSGKSIFLRSITIQQARQADRRTPTRIPVLVELHRLGDSSDVSLMIEQELAECFKRNGFPKAAGFIEHALQDGRLILLLDGLDEVPSTRRAEIAQRIDDFLEEHPRCPAIVTCRTAAFREHYIKEAKVQLLVADFTDQLIQQFLSRWPGISGLPSVSEFMRVLNEAPRMLALARNPLLLTMLAYLYTDVYQETSRLLPRSRAEFYQDATDALLRRWHEKHNSFDANPKRQVLRRLALVGLNRAGNSADRLALESGLVIEEARQVLPAAGQAADNAEGVLREVVERSGLLLEVDGGERFQFAHLTLQEYFAASELAANPNDLLQNYDADPDTWRETVRLWCGSASDCTHVVERVFAKEPVLALECTADAARIEQATVDKVVDHFLAGLTGSLDQRVMRALSELAAIDGRGLQLLARIEGILSEPGERRMAAARVLAATHSGHAARLLLGKFGQTDLFPPLIASMGDIAVPVLAESINQVRTHPDAVPDSALVQQAVRAADALGVIGTPLAVTALASALWADDAVATTAAWRLSELLAHPLTIDALAQWPWEALAESAKSLPRLDWAWMPFITDQQRSSPARTIVGRTAAIIARGRDAPSARYEIDPRLAMAILLVGDSDFTRRIIRHDYMITAEMSAAIEDLLRPGSPPASRVYLKEYENFTGKVELYRWRLFLKGVNLVRSDKERVLADLAIEQTLVSGREDYLLRQLSPRQALQVMDFGMTGPYPTRNWEGVLDKVIYDSDKSTLFRALKSLYVILSIVAATSAVALFMRHDTVWELTLLSLGCASLGVGLLGLLETYDDFEEFMKFAFLSPYMPFSWYDDYGFDPTDPDDLLMFANFGSTPSFILLTSFALSKAAGLPLGAILAGWLLLAVVIASALWRDWHLRRRADNPLRELFTP